MLVSAIATKPVSYCIPEMLSVTFKSNNLEFRANAGVYKTPLPVVVRSPGQRRVAPLHMRVKGKYPFPR